MAMATATQQSDEALAGLAAEGDREAFAALYERYFDPIYDFAARTMRDRELAADVAQTTFMEAWTDLLQGRVPRKFKAWLFTIARHNALDELRRRSRVAVPPHTEDENDDMPAYDQVDVSKLADPETAAEDRELAELVWGAAGALSPREYTVLDLHLRQGLSAGELSETLGVTRGNVYTMLSRLRNSLEESVTTVLLMRRGRRDCPELDALLLGASDDAITREVRQAVQEHLSECPRCQESKRRYVAPAEIFSGLVVIPASPAVRSGVWENISSSVQPGAASGVGPVRPSARSVRRWWRPRSLRQAAVLAAVGAGIAVLLVLALLQLQGGGNALTDPSDVHSTSHRVGQPSSQNVVTLAWSAQSGISAYATLWSELPRELPQPAPTLGGTATGTVSPPLAAGSWYFHLRTQGRDGEWTSTVHVGPFVIVVAAGPPVATASPTPAAVPASIVTATPTATASATPPPTSTATPTPTASAPPRPTPTPTASATPDATATPTLAGPPPEAPTINAIACKPEPALLGAEVTCTASVEGTVTSYAWSADPGDPVAGADATFVTSFATGIAGRGLIELIVCNLGACATADHSVNLIFVEIPPPGSEPTVEPEQPSDREEPPAE